MEIGAHKIVVNGNLWVNIQKFKNFGVIILKINNYG